MAKMSHRVKIKVREVRGCSPAVLGSLAILTIKGMVIHSSYDEAVEEVLLPSIAN